MNRQQVSILGAQVDAVTMAEAVEFVSQAVQQAGTSHVAPQHIITLNAEIIYQAQSDPKLLSIINGANLVTPDGAGVVWAAKYLKKPVPQRVTGIDLLQTIIEEAPKRQWKLFFFGGAPGIAEQAKEKMLQKHENLNIVATNHGYLTSIEEEQQLLKQIKETKPDILIVALGAPRQEFWINKYKEQLQVPVSIGVGGSLDVLSGKATRAPQWVQQVQLEWLYRLVKEPYRYKRMLSLPKFMLKVMGAKK